MYQHVPSRQVPIFPSDTFAVSQYCLASKRTEKKRVEENANVSVFETDNQACTGRVPLCCSLTSLGYKGVTDHTSDSEP